MRFEKKIYRARLLQSENVSIIYVSKRSSQRQDYMYNNNKKKKNDYIFAVIISVPVARPVLYRRRDNYVLITLLLPC